jgi:hypothetical protein
VRLKLVGDDFAHDALSAPDTASLAQQQYNEWHHFTFRDDPAGVRGIVNLALSGDVRDRERGRAIVSVVVHEDDGRWTGTMNVYGSEEARFASGAIDLAIGRSSVRFDGAAYHVSARLKDASVELDATWTPRVEPLRIDSMGGFLSTFIAPRHDVNGRVRIRDRSIAIEGASGYHDHNWGAWEWSRDLGWNWGYLHETAGVAPDRAASIVFGQVTDAARRSARTEPVLMVWRGARLSHVFLDTAVTLQAFGRLDRDIPRVPGLMALLSPGHGGTVPEHLVVEALDGGDSLRVECRVRDAIQLLIPHAAGSAHTNVAELAATYSVSGTIDGEPIAYACNAFAEVAGATRTALLPRVRIGV